MRADATPVVMVSIAVGAANFEPPNAGPVARDSYDRGECPRRARLCTRQRHKNGRVRVVPLPAHEHGCMVEKIRALPPRGVRYRIHFGTFHFGPLTTAGHFLFSVALVWRAVSTGIKRSRTDAQQFANSSHWPCETAANIERFDRSAFLKGPYAQGLRSPAQVERGRGCADGGAAQIFERWVFGCGHGFIGLLRSAYAAIEAASVKLKK